MFAKRSAFANSFIDLIIWLVDILPHSRFLSLGQENERAALHFAGTFLSIVAHLEHAPHGFENSIYTVRFLFVFWQFVISFELPDSKYGYVYQQRAWRFSLRKRALFFSASEKAMMLLSAALGIFIALAVYTVANDIPWCVENYATHRIPHCLVYEGSLIGRYIQP